MALAEFEIAVSALEAADLGIRQQLYDDEMMGSWYIIAVGPGGSWRIAFDGRENTFTTEREVMPGRWDKTLVSAGRNAFIKALRRVCSEPRR